jgi:hypothetical protein
MAALWPELPEDFYTGTANEEGKPTAAPQHQWPRVHLALAHATGNSDACMDFRKLCHMGDLCPEAPKKASRDTDLSDIFVHKNPEDADIMSIFNSKENEMGTNGNDLEKRLADLMAKKNPAAKPALAADTQPGAIRPPDAPEPTDPPPAAPSAALSPPAPEPTPKRGPGRPKKVDVTVHIDPEKVAAPPAAAPSAPVNGGNPAGRLRIFYGCRPVVGKRSTSTEGPFIEWMEKLKAAFCAKMTEKTGKPHYSYKSVAYGEGPGLLAKFMEGNLDTAPEVCIVPKWHPEADLFLSVATAHAHAFTSVL